MQDFIKRICRFLTISADLFKIFFEYSQIGKTSADCDKICDKISI